MSKVTAKKKPGPKTNASHHFDLETLYVECARCGRPLIWEKGTTTFIIQSSGIEKSLGSDWLILSMGCPSCSPDQLEFVLTLARPGSNSARSLKEKQRSN